MPLRPKLPASRIGAVTRLCPGCSDFIQGSMAACPRCWKALPRPLQNAYLAAKDGDCDSGPALAKATADIQEHVRKAAAR